MQINIARTILLILERLLLILDAPLRYVFGRDIFISYSRADAAAYSAGLAEQLGKHFSCYLDQLAVPQGKNLPGPIHRAIRRSTVFVLIGTTGAVRSEFVQQEIQRFLVTRRTIILINVAGQLERAPWIEQPWSGVKGVFQMPETVEALAGGQPSPKVISYIQDCFHFSRQDQRLRRLTWGTAVLVSFVLLAAYLASGHILREAGARVRSADAKAERAHTRYLTASAQASAAEGRYQTATNRAEKAEETEKDANRRAMQAVARESVANTRADQASDRAVAAAARAVQADARANDALGRAVQSQRLELAAKANASLQQKIAYSRQLAGHTAIQIETTPDLALLLAVQAYRAYPTLEARRSLLTALLAYPGLSTIHRLTASPVTGLAASPDGRIFASASADGAVLLWDSAGHHLLERPTAQRERDENWMSALDAMVLFPALAFSPNGALLAAFRPHGRMCIWDVATRTKLATVDDARSLSLAFHGNEQLSVLGDEQILLWDVSNPRHPRRLDPIVPDGAPVGVTHASSPDGRILAFGSGNDIKLYDLISHKILPNILTGHNDPITKLIFSPARDATILASSDERGRLILWDLATYRNTYDSWSNNSGHRGQEESSSDAANWLVTFSSDGKRLARLGTDGSFLVSNVADLRQGVDTHRVEVGVTTKSIVLSGVATKAPMLSIAFANNGRSLVSGTFDGALLFWETGRSQPLGRTIPRPKGGDVLETLGVSDDGRLLASTDGDRKVFLWDIGTSEPPHYLPSVHTRRVSQIAFSPSGKMMATGDDRGSVVLWRVGNRTVLGKADIWQMGRKPKRNDRNGLMFLAFRPGRSEDELVSGSFDGDITLWRVNHLGHFREIVTHRQQRPARVAFSQDGRRMATASYDGGVLLWDLTRPVPTAQTIAPGQGQSVVALSFTSGGRGLITVDEGGAIHARDLGTSPMTYYSFSIGELSRMSDVSISPDGRTMTVASRADKGLGTTIVLWDLGTRTVLNYFNISHYTKFSTFDRPSNQLISISDKDITYCDVSPGLWMKRALLIANRSMTPSERNQFLMDNLDPGSVTRSGSSQTRRPGVHNHSTSQ